MNLTYLRLTINQISDVSPLAELINLTYLGLRENPITTVGPLAELRKNKLRNLHIDEGTPEGGCCAVQ